MPGALVRAALASARRRYLHRRGVVSIHWGLARHEGRSLPEPGVIVLVERKRASLPRAEQIDRWLAVRHGGRTRRIRVDVQAVGRDGLPQQRVRPGNHASVEVTSEGGALGAILEGDDGTYTAVLSGHVARQPGAAVMGKTAGGDPAPLGVVTRVVLDDSTDVARAGPVEAEVATLLAGTAPVNLYDVEEGDLNTALWIQTARDLAPRKAFITDVGATVRFRYDSGVKTVHGLIGVSHQVTEPGDSGGPAVDLHGRLVGFVVGVFDGRTFLVPARRALERLES